MSVIDCISEMISVSGGLFETNQEEVITSILRAEKIVFLDTCFITKSSHMETGDLFRAFENIAGGKEKSKIVFVLTELVLYELKDSVADKLQEKNKEFFSNMAEYGFCMLLLKEETICDNIRPYMSYSVEDWNRRFSNLIHDNIANFTFGKRIRTDCRMPYYGFSEMGFNIPNSSTFVNEIIVYLKNVKTSKDSMAEELISISLFFIFELIRGSFRNEFIFCSHDFGAIARINKSIQTSYANMLCQFKSINNFSIVQYMVNEGILDSKEKVLDSLRKIMGETVKLVIRNDLPFQSFEKTITIEEAVDMIFANQNVDLLGCEI